jgi:hypothetical protein
MSDELKHVAGGFSCRVKSFTIYDVNGYRFRTRTYEETAATAAVAATTTMGASRHQARRLPQVRASPTSMGPRRFLSHDCSLPAAQ